MESITWKTEWRKVCNLIPYDGNPRYLTKRQAEQLQTSIRKFGLVEIPVVNSDNKIIAGHQRVAILYALGRQGEQIEVRVPSRALTPSEFQEYNIRSNKNHGEWDMDKLANEANLGNLQDWGFLEKEIFGTGVAQKHTCPRCGYEY